MHNMIGGWGTWEGLHWRWLTVGVVSHPLNDGFLYSSFQQSAFLVQMWTLAFSKELAVTFRCSWVLPCRCDSSMPCVSIMAVWFFSAGLSSVGCTACVWEFFRADKISAALKGLNSHLEVEDVHNIFITPTKHSAADTKHNSVAYKVVLAVRKKHDSSCPWTQAAAYLWWFLFTLKLGWNFAQLCKKLHTYKVLCTSLEPPIILSLFGRKTGNRWNVFHVSLLISHSFATIRGK